MCAKGRRGTWLSLMQYYPPESNGGAEWMAHELHVYLQREMGFRVIVASPEVRSGVFEGVETRRLFAGDRLADLANGAEIVMTHLGLAALAAHVARRLRKPLIHLIHNTHETPDLSEPEDGPRQYFVYNSRWVRERLHLPRPSIIVPPPVDWRRYKVDTSGRYVSLINVSGDKGGHLLIELARRTPERRFLGVLGFRASPVLDRGLPNLEYREHTPDIRRVYAETRVLLMPSDYESWGRVGIEAMSSGIPVIAHPTPGLRESLGSAGIFCNRDRIESWVETLRALDDQDTYARTSAACELRARALDPTESLRRFGVFAEMILDGRL